MAMAPYRRIGLGDPPVPAIAETYQPGPDGNKYHIALPPGATNGATADMAYVGNDYWTALAAGSVTANYQPGTGYDLTHLGGLGDKFNGTNDTNVAITLTRQFLTNPKSNFLPGYTLDGRPLSREQMFSYDATKDQAARAEGKVYVDAEDFVYTPLTGPANASTPIAEKAPPPSTGTDFQDANPGHSMTVGGGPSVNVLPMGNPEAVVGGSSLGVLGLVAIGIGLAALSSKRRR